MWASKFLVTKFVIISKKIELKNVKQWWTIPTGYNLMLRLSNTWWDIKLKLN